MSLFSGTPILNGSTAAAQGPPAAAASAARALRIHQAHLYPLVYWWTIGGVLGVLAVINVIFFLHTSWRIRSTPSTKRVLESGGAPRTSKSTVAKLWSSITTLNNFILYRWSLPLQRIHSMSVAEAILVLSYVGSNLAWTFVGVVDIHNPTWWANRAGLLCVAQIPFVVALAGKNNVISFLTGISHEKLNGIHRVAGRTTLLLAWIHTFSKVYLGIRGEKGLHDTHIRWGLVAVIALTLVAVLSIRPIRVVGYEFFLMGHIVLVFLFMVATILHEKLFMVRTWPAFVFWGFDRLLRLARLVYLNVFCSPLSTSSLHSEARIERLSSDTVRLTVVRSGNAIINWRAGQHFFLILPGVSQLPWEAHPFTAASIPHKLLRDDGNVELDFIIRGRDGFTKRLLETAIEREEVKSTDGRENVTVLVDGPYGAPPRLHAFDTAILISGGSGVSYTLSLLLDLIYRAQHGPSRTSRVLFIWAIRDRAHLNWIAPSLSSALKALSSSSLSTADPNFHVDVRIYITQSSNSENTSILKVSGTSTPPSPPNEKEKAGDSSSDVTHEKTLESDTSEGVYGLSSGNKQMSLRIEGGRPPLRELLEEEIGLSDGKDVSVDVSGPSALASGVRKALATSDLAGPRAVLRGGANITLHTETFGW